MISPYCFGSVTIKDLNMASFLQHVPRNNTDLKINKLKTAEDKYNWKKEMGDFDTNLSYSYAYNNTDAPSSSSLDGAGNTSSTITKTPSHSLTLSKAFTYGTNISLPYNYDLIDSDSTFRTIAITHEPSIGIELTQPLIRSWVKDYYIKDLVVAELNYQEAIKDEQ